ncbi:hypothetical protein B0H16DRAFT_1599495 [Mycena metata]|uniref:Zn(2)-C6 fungal-type domain-containing protein n=1 Tax=Mycena metata TaxID=1033252 RepID=A0AAD7MLS4_9AGAR|nr:hypothetical protein B0H16DRAFT_1599495 [Mycena metata]
MTSNGQVRNSSCKACHQRKVRCDGQTPCGSCYRARKPSGCEYFSPTSAEGSCVGLSRGSACTPCRQKKRKCNGKLPCSTCEDALRPDACQYRTRRKPDDSAARRLPSDTSVQVRLQHPWVNSPESNTIINLARVTSFPDMVVPRPNVLVPPHHNNEHCSLRALWVEYCVQYGLNLSAEKGEAVVRGDTSGAVVHPIFIPLAELMAYLLVDIFTSERWAHLRGQTARESERRLRIINRLDSRDALDPLTSVQVHQTLALYWVKRRNYQAFQEVLASSSERAIALCDHVAAIGQGDSPPAGPTPQEVVKEGRSALANEIFLEILTLTYVPLQRNIRPVLLAKFRRFLAQAQAAEDHNHLELNFVRAKTALLFEEIQQLVTEWNDCDSGSVVGKEWSERCRNQAHDLLSHLHVLKLVMLSMATKQLLMILKVCTISTLAALAELHAILAPFHAVARQKYRNIIEAIAGITRTFTLEEHESCDFLEVCFEIASRDISQQAPTPKWREYLENVRSSSFSSSPQDVLHFLSPACESESGSSSSYTPDTEQSRFDRAAFLLRAATSLDVTYPTAESIGLLMDSALFEGIFQTTKLQV